MRQKIDMSKDSQEHEFTCAASSATGQTLLIGGFNQIKVLQYMNRRKTWQIYSTKTFKNLNSVASIAWRKDGSSAAVSTSIGSLYIFETVFK